MKAYKINTINLPSIYVSSIKKIYAWAKLNPGEMQSFEEVETIEELDRLAAEVDRLERELQWHKEAQ